MARIGLALTGGLAPGEIVECVQLAEELGYESVWMEEGHGGDQFAILTACALATTRIRLGTAISSVFVRSVPTIAMVAATVDHLSQQRLILGLGSSHKVQVEPEHGLPYGRPVSRIRDSVAVIRTLLRDGVVSYQGKTVTIERFDLWFTPIRQEIPIYLAALFPPCSRCVGNSPKGSSWPGACWGPLDKRLSISPEVRTGWAGSPRRLTWPRSCPVAWRQASKRRSMPSDPWSPSLGAFSHATSGSWQSMGSPRQRGRSEPPGSKGTERVRPEQCRMP